MFVSLEAIAKLRRELDAAEAAWLKEVAAYERSYDWRAEGFMNPASALRHACHMSQGVARGHLELARKLEDLPEVAAAFAEGDISARHATAIAVSFTPERAAGISEVETALVDYAREATPHDLGRVVKYVTDAIDGDGGAAAEEARYQRRRLHMSRTLDGMLVEDGLFDPESARIRDAAIDAEMARDLGANDDRSLAQRRADASTNIMRLYLDRGEGGESHGVQPHVSYVLDAETGLDASADLVARAIAERRHNGHLSEAMLDLLLCDCDISRVIVAGRSEVLDVGRATPTATPGQWKALVVRDQHCQHPGCDRPPSHCQAHHIRHWTRGGPTDLDNLQLLCWYHHRQRHRQDALARAPGKTVRDRCHSVRVAEWWETAPGDPPGFAEWLRSHYHFDAADPGEVEADNRRWLRDYFAENGPVGAEVVGRAFQARQAEIATQAVSAVRADLQRTTAERPNLAVELDEWGGVRVTVDGGYSGSPVWHIDPAAVLVEVADDIQDQMQGVVVDGAWRFWPECLKHNAGLHAELHDGRAVWRCRLGDHELALIGQLGQNT